MRCIQIGLRTDFLLRGKNLLMETGTNSTNSFRFDIYDSGGTLKPPGHKRNDFTGCRDF